MLDSNLLRIHSRVTRCPLCARFVAFTRLLLAAGFVLPGLTKLFGHRFTVLGTETPVGAFFEALYQTGAYWRFLGLVQVLAAALILVPRLALVGTGLFFGLMLNIAVLTNAVGFGGTRWITLAMLGATVLLLFWDYPALRPVLGLNTREAGLTPIRLTRLEWAGAILASALSWYSLLLTFGVLGMTLPAALGIGATSGLIGATLLFGPILRDRWSPRVE